MLDPSVLILCVNYNTDAVVLQFADSVASLDEADQIHLVCADCSPEQPSQVLHERAETDSRFSYIPLGENAGYFGGAARALNAFEAAGGQVPEWIVVSNTDISFPTPDLFQQLQTRHADGRFDIVAPAITSMLTGAAQNPHMVSRPPVARMRFLRDLAKRFFLANIYQVLARARARLRGARRVKRLQSGADPYPIYAPHGAFIAFRRTYFEFGGQLDYPGFLFGEEVYVAETARELGLQVGYDPAVCVEHDEHVATRSSRRLFRSRESLQLAHTSRDFLYRTYFARRSRGSV